VALALEIFDCVIDRRTLEGETAAKLRNVDFDFPADAAVVWNLCVNMNLVVNVLQILESREGYVLKLTETTLPDLVIPYGPERSGIVMP